MPFNSFAIQMPYNKWAQQHNAEVEVVSLTETLKFGGLWKFDKWKLLNQEVDVVGSHSVQHNHNQIKGAQCTSGVEVFIRREISPLAGYFMPSKLNKQTLLVFMTE